MNILPGDVLFVWGNGIVDDLIEWVTEGPSHCALFIDSDTVAEAQFNRVTGTTPLSTYQSMQGYKLEVWRDTSLTDEERKNIVEYAKKNFGLHYDYLAILVELARFKLDFNLTGLNEGKRRICSSYVNDCAKSIGKDWSNVPYAPAPVDLLNGGKLQLEGVL